MSSNLADIINRVIELAQDDRGNIDTHHAVSLAEPLVMADDEAVTAAVREALAKRIKDVATAVRKAAEKADPRMLYFDGLRPRYAVDTDGRVLRKTEELTRIEYERVLQIRREQIAADAAHLKVLESALEAVHVIWDAHPHLKFGEVKEMFLRTGEAA